MNRSVTQTLSILAVVVLASTAFHVTASNDGPGDAPAQDQANERSWAPIVMPKAGYWTDLSSERQDLILHRTGQLVGGFEPAFASEWRNLTDRDLSVVAELVPGIYDSWMGSTASSDGEPSEEEVAGALWQATLEVASALGIPLPMESSSLRLGHGFPLLPTLPTLPGSGPQPTSACQGLPGPLSIPFMVVNCLLGGAVLLVVAVALLAAAVTLQVAMIGAQAGLQVIYATVVQLDEDTDGIGDAYQERFGKLLAWSQDFDGDGLGNVEEFRWDLVPICTPTFKNCADHERSSATGLGGDGWLDGPEVHYWDDTSNNAYVSSAEGVSFYDPDRLVDSDGDGQSNVNDIDSDNDDLLDGEERPLGAYPEFADSDCDVTATQCTASSATTFRGSRNGNPGTGDGLSDNAERIAWEALGGGKLGTDFDGDGIARNLLDPDADADGLLDGEEFTLDLKRQVRPDLIDTDFDGLIDGQEVAWSQDTDLDGRVNANDVDSDDDGMPDKWEADHDFNMVDPSDALADRDGDLLNNLGEYLHATDPSDMDSEGTRIEQGDLLLDGEEVNIHHTDPHHWDTDRDGMADRYEAVNSLQPTNAADADDDPDGDSFDQGNDGSLENPWPNLKEYRYGRPATWDETTTGPWMGGTLPHDADSDKDSALDGYEAYYQTNPQVPADTSTDDDEDGLTFAEEAEEGTDPNDPDTDGDGLCDGGRAARCIRDNLPHQAGERDYGLRPWSTDSDEDLMPDFQEVVLWDPGASGTAADVDGDGVTGPADRDSDNDELLDGDERTTDPALPDTDADKLIDGDEIHHYFTDPTKADTDADLLPDGQEVALGTSPTLYDSDGDGLGDGDEVSGWYSSPTDPLLPDSDGDNLPDGWEVHQVTQPMTPDGAADPDADGLTNYGEYSHGTRPLKPDTDADGMPDGFEVVHGLNPRSNDRNADLDGDGLTNFREYEAGTLPEIGDTDNDGRPDGWEVNNAKSDPLAKDTDRDAMEDGAEYSAWASVSGTAWSANHDGDTFANGIVDADSDNDGLLDAEEFLNTRTKPHVSDSDGDGLTDFTEVVTYQGQYDPNRADTDGDGKRDNVEVALADTNGDFDKDGLKNGDETSFGTDFSVPDSDCDGIPDGPEAIYWNAWSSGGSRLLSPDVDGDGISDGVEIGWVGTPQQAMYRTRPDRYDTDSDGLGDNEEARNNYRVACGQTQGTASLGIAGQVLPSPLPGAELARVQRDAGLLAGLVEGKLYQESSGLRYGIDGEGLYVQGAYGVRLYLESPGWAVDDVPLGSSPAPPMTGAGPGSNGKLTDPMMPDSDGDGLKDGEEVMGSRNPYPGRSNANGPAGNTDPWQCDSDADGLGDGIEVGIDASRPTRRETSVVCQQRDAEPGTLTNPNGQDTDKDTLPDGTEDPNGNGRMDARWNGHFYEREAGAAAESNPLDGDSDDDGLSDSEEKGSEGYNTNFDRDFDGLSDGLELGRRTPVVIDGVLQTNPSQRAYGIDWPTWQPYQGLTVDRPTLVGDPDTDDDGLLDGLEDLTHNGKFNEPVAGKKETDPHIFDSDGDKLGDGHELLTHGKFGFDLFVKKRGSPYAVVYDAAPLKTDPWKKNTDETSRDKTMDGLDINPRGDGLLTLSFSQFWQHDMIERDYSDPRSADRYRTDLAMQITLGTPAGDFLIVTEPLNNFGSKYGRYFSDVPLEDQTPPLGMEGAADSISQAWSSVSFNLPEDVTALTRGGGMNVDIEVYGVDLDDDCRGGWFKCGWFDPNKHDILDLSEKKGGTTYIDPLGFNLEGGNPNQQWPSGKWWQANGNDDHADEKGVDAELWLHGSSNIVPYFLTSAMGKHVPTGQCLGGIAPSGGSCV